MSEQWNDDVLRAVGQVHQTLNFMVRERSQLYGTIMHLMKLLDTKKVLLPSNEELLAYGEAEYVLYSKDEEDFFVGLYPRLPKENEDEPD